MKLHYRILWVDDQIEDYIELGIKDEIDSYIDSLGFLTTIDCFENGTMAEKHILNSRYDLILSDYNIEGANEQGDSLIQKIRDSGVYTEVLFYSAQSDFDQIAKNLYRDRVSFFSLIGDESYRGFKDKVFNLVNLTVSKLQELNSIRGLVMAETSELDNTVEEILFSFLSKQNEQSEVLRSYLCKTVSDSVEGNLKKAKGFCELDVLGMVKSRLLDADKKCRAIGRMLELVKLEGAQFSGFYSRYKLEVLDTRNDLAHAKSDVIDGVEYLITSRKGVDEPVKFGQEHCIGVRKNLRYHSDVLRSIREAIIG